MPAADAAPGAVPDPSGSTATAGVSPDDPVALEERRLRARAAITCSPARAPPAHTTPWATHDAHIAGHAGPRARPARPAHNENVF